ncbi:DEKNAAC102339 [Brettanomyces naardenensis]|uniref:DEKNAAC102339 n=1 Tax=Brettanomyces naardenensis TaxID=13370 RepID=A0A448YLH5_BRENA|nr:DEKNAAC102339 [Brettanomyces naardenensis]
MTRQLDPVTERQFNDVIKTLLDLKVVELKEICRAFKLTMMGRKADLQDRIQRYLTDAKIRGNSQVVAAVCDFILKEHFLFPPNHFLPRSSDSTNGYTTRTPTTTGTATTTAAAANKRQHRPQRQLHIYFKKSPFFVLKRLITADGNNPSFARVQPKGRGTVHISFTLTESELELLHSSKKMHLFLVSGAAGETGSSQSSENKDIEFPQPIELTYNGVKLTDNVKGIKGKVGSAKPADLTPRLHENGVNVVDVVYAYTQRSFLMYIYIVEITTVEELLETVLSRPHIPKDATVKMIREGAEQDDMVASKELVSLNCPCSYMRMEHPCRSQTCQHIQCFDAYSFLNLQDQAPMWVCPICSHKISLETLAVDDYFTEIIHNTNSDIEYVELDSSGKWTPKVNIQDEYGARQRAAGSVKQEEAVVPPPNGVIEVIDLDSDAEEETDEERTVTPANLPGSGSDDPPQEPSTSPAVTGAVESQPIVIELDSESEDEEIDTATKENAPVIPPTGVPDVSFQNYNESHRSTTNFHGMGHPTANTASANVHERVWEKSNGTDATVIDHQASPAGNSHLGSSADSHRANSVAPQVTSSDDFRTATFPSSAFPRNAADVGGGQLLTFSSPAYDSGPMKNPFDSPVNTHPGSLLAFNVAAAVATKDSNPANISLANYRITTTTPILSESAHGSATTATGVSTFAPLITAPSLGPAPLTSQETATSLSGSEDATSIGQEAHPDPSNVAPYLQNPKRSAEPDCRPSKVRVLETEKFGKQPWYVQRIPSNASLAPSSSTAMNDFAASTASTGLGGSSSNSVARDERFSSPQSDTFKSNVSELYSGALESEIEGISAMSNRLSALYRSFSIGDTRIRDTILAHAVGNSSFQSQHSSHLKHLSIDVVRYLEDSLSVCCTMLEGIVSREKRTSKLLLGTLAQMYSEEQAKFTVNMEPLQYSELVKRLSRVQQRLLACKAVYRVNFELERQIKACKKSMLKHARYTESKKRVLEMLSKVAYAIRIENANTDKSTSSKGELTIYDKLALFEIHQFMNGAGIHLESAYEPVEEEMVQLRRISDMVKSFDASNFADCISVVPQSVGTGTTPPKIHQEHSNSAPMSRKATSSEGQMQLPTTNGTAEIQRSPPLAQPTSVPNLGNFPHNTAQQTADFTSTNGTSHILEQLNVGKDDESGRTVGAKRLSSEAQRSGETERIENATWVATTSIRAELDRRVKDALVAGEAHKVEEAMSAEKQQNLEAQNAEETKPGEARKAVESRKDDEEAQRAKQAPGTQPEVQKAVEGRRLLIAHEAEETRKAKEVHGAEEAHKAEEERKEEKACKEEETRRAEEVRKKEEARKANEAAAARGTEEERNSGVAREENGRRTEKIGKVPGIQRPEGAKTARDRMLAEVRGRIEDAKRKAMAVEVKKKAALKEAANKVKETGKIREQAGKDQERRRVPEEVKMKENAHTELTRKAGEVEKTAEGKGATACTALLRNQSPFIGNKPVVDGIQKKAGESAQLQETLRGRISESGLQKEVAEANAVHEGTSSPASSAPNKASNYPLPESAKGSEEDVSKGLLGFSVSLMRVKEMLHNKSSYQKPIKSATPEDMLPPLPPPPGSPNLHTDAHKVHRSALQAEHPEQRDVIDLTLSD